MGLKENKVVGWTQAEFQEKQLVPGHESQLSEQRTLLYIGSKGSQEVLKIVGIVGSGMGTRIPNLWGRR